MIGTATHLWFKDFAIFINRREERTNDSRARCLKVSTFWQCQVGIGGKNMERRCIKLKYEYRGMIEGRKNEI